MSKKVFLSAGHGGTDPGAVANGLKEKDINLNILLACKAMLEKHGVTVISSRLKDENDPVAQEVKEANASGADVAVSFHTNAGGGDGSETFYYPTSSQSKKLAELCEKHTKLIGQNSRGIKSGANLMFVNSTKMISVLCECGFVDNANDKKLIDTKAEQAKFGEAYAKAILEYFGIPYKNTQNETKTDFDNLSIGQIIAKIGPLFTADQRKSGILASVSMAQLLLESAMCKSELAQKANNYFGMKTNLSNNVWSGSTWDGKSVYTKKTNETINGKTVEVVADFRAYKSIEESISDHSAYLNGAMNGSTKRYAGLSGCVDHTKAIQIIKDGGYATDPSYVQKVLQVIKTYGLTKFDLPTSLNSKASFAVRVNIVNLNIRKGPGTNYDVVGQTGKGLFTIVETKDGWGKLKSGAGWISLNYVTRL